MIYNVVLREHAAMSQGLNDYDINTTCNTRSNNYSTFILEKRFTSFPTLN